MAKIGSATKAFYAYEGLAALSPRIPRRVKQINPHIKPLAVAERKSYV